MCTSVHHAVNAPIKELIENNRMNRRVHVNITTQKLTRALRNLGARGAIQSNRG